MEFPFNVADLFSHEFNIVERDLRVKDASAVQPLEEPASDFTKDHPSPTTSSPVSTRKREFQEQLGRVIDALGEASRAAQSLSAAVTTTEKLRRSRHRVYILVESTADGRALVLGLLKVGFKQLFLRDEHSRLCQVRPLCLLDFYVHESRQRQGCGRRLFDCMTKTESLSPAQLPIDHPSEKLLSFMERHFGLAPALPQNNHFAVFPGFFEGLRQLPALGAFLGTGLQTEQSPRNRSRDQGRLPVTKRSRPHSLDSSLVGGCLEWTSYERGSHSRCSMPPQDSQAWQLLRSSGVVPQEGSSEAAHVPGCWSPNPSSWAIFGLAPPDYPGCPATSH
ncbi:alpha-tubulin N-acetyltransferase 1 [Ixodes scapularis]